MSVSNDSTGTIDDDRASFSSTFLEFCDKVRRDDPSILPEPGKHFKIGNLSEREDMELTDATYLQLDTKKYTKSSAEAMQSTCEPASACNTFAGQQDRVLQQREDMFCCFLPAFQESTSVKELHINFSLIPGPSNLALENTPSSLGWAVQPDTRKSVDAHPELTVSTLYLSRWPIIR